MASIRATARAAARKAFEAAGDALIDATIYLQPTAGTYDPATDSAAVTWGLTKATQTLEFDDKEQEKDAETVSSPEGRMRAFLFLGEHLVTGGGVELRGEQEGEIDAGGLKFSIEEAETDPTGTVWIFYCLQKGLATPPAP